jgi:hypothetical protein
MSGPAASKLSAGIILAFIAAGSASVPAAANDYRDSYGNSEYYGNYYRHDGGHDQSRADSDNSEDQIPGQSQHQHHAHPISGNECSSDAIAGQDCGGNP